MPAQGSKKKGRKREKDRGEKEENKEAPDTCYAPPQVRSALSYPPQRVKHTPGGILVDSIGVVVIQALDALLQFVTLGALLNADQEQIIVGVQGELVHRIYARQVVQYKVQDGSTHTAGLVSCCSRLNLLGSGFRHLHTCHKLHTFASEDSQSRQITASLPDETSILCTCLLYAEVRVAEPRCFASFCLETWPDCKLHAATYHHSCLCVQVGAKTDGAREDMQQ